MTAILSEIGVEYVTVSLTSDVTLDTQPVDFAFMPGWHTYPDETTIWHPAEWVGEAGTTRDAQLLIGALVELDHGDHVVWIRVDDGTELIIRRAGVITVL